MDLAKRVKAVELLVLAEWPTELGGAFLRWRSYRALMRSDSARFNFQAGCTVTGFENLSIGEGTNIMRGARLYAHESRGLVIGSRCSFNHNVFISAADGGRVELGDDVLFGPNVVLRAADHRFDRTDIPIRQQGHVGGDIIIESDVWLGANVVVTSGVRIGHGCVVGAGSVVTTDLPPMTLSVGVPARVIKKRG